MRRLMSPQLRALMLRLNFLLTDLVIISRVSKIVAAIIQIRAPF